MKVVIAEKPSVAKAIASFFGATQRGDGCITGNGVAVTHCFGHLFEQLEPDAYDEKFKKWDMSHLPIVPELWKLQGKDDAKKQIKIIGDLLKGATEIVHAGDPDREGQLLVDEVLEHFECKAPVRRLWLAAMDDESIKKAIASMKDGREYASLKLAAESRARADWLVGMNLTRGWTIHGRKFNHGVLSVGRVQTPTLAMIVKRDLAVEAFKSRDFYQVEAAFPFAAIWKPSEAIKVDEDGRLLDRPVADAVAAKINGKTASVVKYESKPCSQAAPLPYSLSALQQKASAKYGFSAQDVLDIAQALYETHKVTSYPRPDCRFLPESMHAEAARVLQGIKAPVTADASIKSGAFSDKKITAHHAIIPNGKAPSGLSDAERKIYDLIAQAYLCQFYPDHKYQQVNIAVEVEGETFTASGRATLDEGWKVVFSGEADDDEGDDKEPSQTLPKLAVGDSLTCSEAKVLAKKTTPPKRYTDGTLIADMTNVHKYVEDAAIKARLKETAGIGTEATRAGIIETLLRRKFIEKKGKNLISTEAGRALIAALGNADVVNVGTTGVFEGQLDDIAQGKLDQATFLRGVVENVTAQIAVFKGGNAPVMAQGNAPQKQFKPAEAAEGVKCPKCGASMIKLMNKAKGTEFYGCSKFRETGCKGSMPVK